MSENTSDAVHQILVKIQDSISSLRSEFGQAQRDIANRFDRLEEVVRKQRRDSAGMLVMMRATVGAFDERVSDVEARMAALEAKKS